MFGSWAKRPDGDDKPAAAPTAPSHVPAAADEPSARHGLSLLSLLELSDELNARQDVFEIAEVALFNLMGHFGCSRGAVWMLPGGGSKSAVLVRAQGIPEPVARGAGLLWTKWLLGQPAGLLESVLVSEMSGVGAVPGLDLAEQGGIALFAPITARKKVVGVFALGKRVGGGSFGVMDREVLHASLNLLGVAAENANLLNRAVENNRRLRYANEQLQDLDRMKSEFLNNMNHELRTPLTVIIAYLESIITGEPENSPRLEHLGIVRDQAAHLHSLVLNVLDFHEVAGENVEIRPERGDVKAVLSVYHRDRQPGIVAELREFVFSCASDVPPALFDRDRLVQIVDALVENAVKFTPRGARILLRVEREREGEDDMIRIDVEDNGPGIPADRLPHIFESFRQGDGSETRAHGGMGLGLAMAKRVAEKMNGQLSVETELRAGTVFTLRVPAA